MASLAMNHKGLRGAISQCGGMARASGATKMVRMDWPLRQRRSGPHFGDGVLRCNQRLAVGAKGDAIHLRLASSKGEDFQACVGLPYFHGAVFAAGDDALAVRAEGHAEQVAGVPVEHEEFLARVGIPNFCLMVVAPSDDAPAVRAERHATDAAAVAFPGENLPAGRGLPQFHLSIQRAPSHDALAVWTERHTPSRLGMLKGEP